jgi:hypothetical protein
MELDHIRVRLRADRIEHLTLSRSAPARSPRWSRPIDPCSWVTSLGCAGRGRPVCRSRQQRIRGWALFAESSASRTLNACMPRRPRLLSRTSDSCELWIPNRPCIATSRHKTIDTARSTAYDFGELSSASAQSQCSVSTVRSGRGRLCSARAFPRLAGGAPWDRRRARAETVHYETYQALLPHSDNQYDSNAVAGRVLRRDAQDCRLGFRPAGRESVADDVGHLGSTSALADQPSAVIGMDIAPCIDGVIVELLAC